jgi:DnaJ-class molecular chaperone
VAYRYAAQKLHPPDWRAGEDHCFTKLQEAREILLIPAS